MTHDTARWPADSYVTAPMSCSSAVSPEQRLLVTREHPERGFSATRITRREFFVDFEGTYKAARLGGTPELRPLSPRHGHIF